MSDVQRAHISGTRRTNIEKLKFVELETTVINADISGQYLFHITGLRDFIIIITQ